MKQGRAPAPSLLTDPVARAVGATVEVRRHPGARRMTLRVSRTRRAVIVTLPMQCDIDEATPFIHRHIDWVRERLDSLPDPVLFAHDVVIPLRGEAHRLVFAGRAAESGGIVARQPAAGGSCPVLDVSGRPDQAPRRLLNWLSEEARRDIDRCVLWHARNLGLKAKRIAIRDQTSRWGSCSTTGVLSFSWRLVLAPPLVLDYVAAHEVAHIAEMNHGPRFWALVRKTFPRMDDAKDWLQLYGMDLHRYGVESARD